MASEVLQFAALIPANTPKTALSTTSLELGEWVVESIDLEVPAGPDGLMGFYLALSGEQWIPHSPGQFIVWDDVSDSWYLNDQPTTDTWSIVGYNLDAANAHQVVVRFHVNPLPNPGGGVPALPPLAALAPLLGATQ